MSYFKCPSCEEKHNIFGTSKAFDQALVDMGLDKLADIPLEATTSHQSDAGRPIVLGQGATSQAFQSLGRKVWDQIA